MARLHIVCEEFETTEYVFSHVPFLPTCGLQRGGRRDASISDDSSGNYEPDSTNSDQNTSASASSSDDKVSAPINADLRESDIDVERYSGISEDSWASDPEALQLSASSSDGVDEDDEDENPSSSWLSQRNRYFRLTAVEPTDDVPPVPHTVISHGSEHSLRRRSTKRPFEYTRGQRIRLNLLRSSDLPGTTDEERIAKRQRCDP